MRTGFAIICLAVASPALAQSIASRVTTPSDRALLTALVAMEDSRVATLPMTDVRRRGLASRNSYLRAFTVRGLGRLEDPSLIPVIARSLEDSLPEVRVAAADAVAQAAARALPAGADARARARFASSAVSAQAQLVPRLQVEREPAVRAALLEAIGRLNPGSVDQVKGTATIIAPSLSVQSIVERQGAIRGLFFLARKREARASGAIPADVTDRMYAMLRDPSQGLTPTDRYNLAFALVGASALNDARMAELFTDADPFVRDRAVLALGRAADSAMARSIVLRALADVAPVVRFRAVGAYAQRLRAREGCGPLMRLTADPDMHVALAATDALGCREGETARLLDSIASGFRDDEHWHRPTHAFVSLAGVDPARARALLPRFMTSRSFFVRTHAAVAARRVEHVASLHALARDAHPNVRSAAIEALSALVGHAADSLYLAAFAWSDEQLTRSGQADNQLLMSAAAALKGSPLAGVAPAAIGTLQRLRGRGATNKDGEDALIALINALGAPPVAGTRRAPRIAVPAFAELAAHERSIATIEMADGAIITMRFHPFDAPTNVARFVRLAKAGAFDGLTFHRVAPFFVVQGPGPYANEYSAPDRPFARDELAVSNVRGTVGLSTRGRDTGDGQIFINTVDNVWLDHDYTVLATVVEGLEAFDRMQEGARIRKVTVALAGTGAGR